MRPGILAWIKKPEEDTERLVAAFVIRLPDGISNEGADHLLAPINTIVDAAGGEIVAQTIGHGFAVPAAIRVLTAFWQPDKCPNDLTGDGCGLSSCPICGAS